MLAGNENVHLSSDINKFQFVVNMPEYYKYKINKVHRKLKKKITGNYLIEFTHYRIENVEQKHSSKIKTNFH